MAKRRNIIVAFLLIAVLIMGIGYAGVSTMLEIDADVASAVQAIDVVFTDGSASADPATITVDHGWTSDTIRVEPSISGLTDVGDEVVLTYTLSNKNEYDVTLVEPVITLASTTVLTVDVDVDGMTITGESDSMTLAAGASTTVTVTVTLKTASADAITESFVISIEAYAGNQG